MTARQMQRATTGRLVLLMIIIADVVLINELMHYRQIYLPSIRMRSLTIVISRAG